ncbi:ephrin type-A receptor 4a-like [Dysidea avara]|uniref:ephrin type-A receptor 4a-like n=1 Tax=Dysidea avara TaxID=196820 RepID=UPI003333EA69
MEYSNDTKLSYSTVYDDTRVSSSLSGGDEVECFSDPGHSEEAIYSCFESKRFRTINANTVRMSQRLGSGEFGVVHLGTWTDGFADPIQVAVKTLNSKCSESDRVKFLREAAIMGQFQHNYIVGLYGVVAEKENKMIILEYMPKGDLCKLLVDLKSMTPPEAYGEMKHDLLSFCRQVSSGLSYLASKQFVHRDLAARNILVSSDDVCKIADFGMARDMSNDTYYASTGGKIPLKWTAPEAILYKKYSTQSDVWSFGCVMYEIWSLGHKPFEDCDGREYINKITTGYRLPPPPGCPRAIYELMIQCWNPLPNRRIDPCEILRTLQKSDRTLLPHAMTPSDSEELFTTLGESLDTSHHIFIDLQNTYFHN